MAAQMNIYPQSTESVQVKGYVLSRHPSQKVYPH